MTHVFTSSAPRKAPFSQALLVATLAALMSTACGGGGETVADAGAPTATGTSDADVPGRASPTAGVAGAAAGAPGTALPVVLPTAPSPTPAKVVVDTADTGASADDTVQTVVPTEMVLNNLFNDGLTNWTVGDSVLVNSAERVGGKALNVGWRTLQMFAHGTLVPRATYTLKVRARNERTTGSATIAVKFKIPSNGEAFRTHTLTVTGNTYKDYELDFTAPAYSRAELSIIASGTRTVVESFSVKMRAPIPLTQSIASPSGSFVPSGYQLAFNDEFNGTQLDRTKWHTRMVYNSGQLDRMHDEKQRYRDNGNHVVANGVLSLIARKVSESDPDGINYESGMIRSDWTSRYGYYEARVKMPAGKGVWPAFWLNSDVSETGRLAWPPEIDIFEYVINGVEDKPDMIHSGVVPQNGIASELFYADAAFNAQWTFWKAPFDFSAGWHVVGAEWTPTTVTMYVDGKKIYSRAYSWNYKDGTLAGPAHMLMNFAVGGAWPGRHGIDDTAFPQALQVDWIRAYRKVN